MLYQRSVLRYRSLPPSLRPSGFPMPLHKRFLSKPHLVPDLDRGQRTRAGSARSYSGDAIRTSPGVFPMEGC